MLYFCSKWLPYSCLHRINLNVELFELALLILLFRYLFPSYSYLSLLANRLKGAKLTFLCNIIKNKLS